MVGLAAFPFRIYLPVLLLGHVGGSLGLAYIGAGIDTRDWLFWAITGSVLFLAGSLTFLVRKLASVRKQ